MKRSNETIIELDVNPRMYYPYLRAKARCLIPHCPSKYYCGHNETTEFKNMKFFHFPNNKERRKQWIDIIKKETGLEIPFNPHSASGRLICCKHFPKRFLDASSRLLKMGYPTLFPLEIRDSDVPDTLEKGDCTKGNGIFENQEINKKIHREDQDGTQSNKVFKNLGINSVEEATRIPENLQEQPNERGYPTLFPLEMKESNLPDTQEKGNGIFENQEINKKIHREEQDGTQSNMVFKNLGINSVEEASKIPENLQEQPNERGYLTLFPLEMKESNLPDTQEKGDCKKGNGIFENQEINKKIHREDQDGTQSNMVFKNLGINSVEEASKIPENLQEQPNERGYLTVFPLEIKQSNLADTQEKGGCKKGNGTFENQEINKKIHREEQDVTQSNKLSKKWGTNRVEEASKIPELLQEQPNKSWDNSSIDLTNIAIVKDTPNDILQRLGEERTQTASKDEYFLLEVSDTFTAGNLSTKDNSIFSSICKIKEYETHTFNTDKFIILEIPDSVASSKAVVNNAEQHPLLEHNLNAPER